MAEGGLPAGHRGAVHIEPDPTHDGGDFAGGGWKLGSHTSEGLDLRAMQGVLKSKRAEPHLLIGRKGTGRQDFTVVQFIPFTQASRALEHPPGTMDTNNARCIQVEICEYAKNAADWNQELLDALGALTVLVEHRVAVPRLSPRAFAVPAKRYTQRGFVAAKG